MTPADQRPGQAASLARAEARARDAHRRGVQAGSVGHPATAARIVRSGLRALGWDEHGDRPEAQQVHPPHHALAARMLSSLAHFESEQGRTEYGLGLLDRADALAVAEDRGIVLYQRGLVLIRTGRFGDALGLFDQAVPILQGYPDTAHLARALLNRGVCQLNTGHVQLARSDLISAERILKAAGLSLIAAKAMHNQGYCDLLAGDIPAALRLFDAAGDIYRAGAPGNLPVLAIDKARALLAAGLANDAAHELDTAIAAFRRQRLDQDRIDAELTRSQAALAADDLAAARHWATAALRHSRRRGNQACACLAELARLRAQVISPSTAGRVAREALPLARQLHALGLRNDADVARLHGARALVTAGRPSQARQQLAAVRRRGAAVSLDVSLLRRLTLAELALAEGQPTTALAELRAGLRAVQTRRGRLGSPDLQTGTAVLGAELAATGLRLALNRRSAPMVFAWLERSRAQAFRVAPVRPPPDPQTASVLAEVRQLSHLIRTAELAGRRDTASIARRAELQRTLRERSWQANGPGKITAQAGLSEVGAALQESQQALAAILALDGRLLAVVIQGGIARLIGLGDADMAAEAARCLIADLDTLAGRHLPRRLDEVIRESARRQTAILTAEIVAPLLASVGDDRLVLAPPGVLAGIPWGLLPGLRGRPVTVCPSASSWLAAWRRAQTSPASLPGATPLLVAGPNLVHAPQEVHEIAKIYPGCQPLTAEKATVEATLRGLDGAWLAHLAAHGYQEPENVLFSKLELADGPLIAYDIQRLAVAPRQVILSACDVGRAIVRPGEEVLGFTAALLHLGTTNVIASVTRVADDISSSLMTAYHYALKADTRPAEALASATEAEPLNPFVCFGAG
jgi:CHAT domain-containing protein